MTELLRRYGLSDERKFSLLLLLFSHSLMLKHTERAYKVSAIFKILHFYLMNCRNLLFKLIKFHHLKLLKK